MYIHTHTHTRARAKARARARARERGGEEGGGTDLNYANHDIIGNQPSLNKKIGAFHFQYNSNAVALWVPFLENFNFQKF
jgi:molybdenum-dependent DNA-binding transcriptional regulator ModE